MNLLEDLSTLTTIPRSALDKLLKKSEGCICHTIQENLLNHDLITEIDAGVGSLYIKVEGDEVKYKFIPSATFEESVKTTIQTGKSPLEISLEEALRQRIIHTYKDLF